MNMYSNNVDFYETEMVLQLSVKSLSIKFNQNLLSSYRVETFGRIRVTGKRRDATSSTRTGYQFMQKRAITDSNLELVNRP